MYALILDGIFLLKHNFLCLLHYSNVGNILSKPVPDVLRLPHLVNNSSLHHQKGADLIYFETLLLKKISRCRKVQKSSKTGKVDHDGAEGNGGCHLFSRMLTELVMILDFVVSLMLNHPLFNPSTVAEMPE